MSTSLRRLAESIGPEDADPMDVESVETWTPPEVLTAREVCEIELPEGQEVLGQLIMAGARLVIGGSSGQGKTTMTMAMVSAVANGTQWLDWTGCGRRVLVIDVEQGLRTVQKRLREAKLDTCENVDYVRVPDGLALDRDETQAAWLRGLIVERGYAMVVIDPLYKAHEGDSNDERAMVDLMRKLDRLRDEMGFALVIPMHLRKLDPRTVDPVMDDIFGSGGLTRGADIVLGIRQLAPGHSRLYFWKDRDGDLGEHRRWSLTFSREDGYERDPEDDKAPAHVSIGRAFLANGGGIMTIKQLTAAIGTSDKTVREALRGMMERGEVAEDGKGAHGVVHYRLQKLPDEDVERWEAMAGG